MLGDVSEWFKTPHEYLRYEYDLLPDDYVIDLGSYKYEWSTKIHKKYGCYVDCFDACIDRAAWIYDGKIRIYGENETATKFGQGKWIESKCYDISEFCKKPVRLIKINIEGSEYRIIQRLIETETIQNIQDLQVQFHIVDGNTSIYDSLAKRLSETHELTWRYPFVWENWRRKC
jgi:hypothetical protein